MFAPNNKRIIGILEVVQVRATIENVRRGEEGSLLFDYTGGNTLNTSTQSPISHEGQRVFIDEDGDLWREAQLRSIIMGAT